MSEIPITKVFLVFSVVVRMICIPAITMKHVTKTRMASTNKPDQRMIDALYGRPAGSPLLQH